MGHGFKTTALSMPHQQHQGALTFAKMLLGASLLMSLKLFPAPMVNTSCTSQPTRVQMVENMVGATAAAKAMVPAMVQQVQVTVQAGPLGRATRTCLGQWILMVGGLRSRSFF